jgi:hypothetical protein
VNELDELLKKNGAITLTELRKEYPEDYSKILRRKKIRNEAEYNLVRGVLDDTERGSEQERELLGKLISEFDKT